MPDAVERVAAVVLAGAKPRAGLPPEDWNRALMRVNGAPMFAHVCAALRAASSVGAVTVVGNVPDEPGCVRIPDAGGFVENLMAGVEAAGGERVVVCSSDVPFLTPRSVDDFVTRALQCDADIVYPIVPVDICKRQFPTLRRTALGLREGRFTGGNLVVVKVPFLAANRARIADTYAARKNVLRLGMMLGPVALARIALAAMGVANAVGVQDLERAVGRVIGGTARAVVSQFPEVATDIDRPEDVAVFETA